MNITECHFSYIVLEEPQYFKLDYKATLSVCPTKNRCRPELTSKSTTREWQGYSNLVSSALNSNWKVQEKWRTQTSLVYRSLEGLE